MQFLNVPFWDVVVMVFIPTLLLLPGDLLHAWRWKRGDYGFAPPEAEAKTVARSCSPRGITDLPGRSGRAPGGLEQIPEYAAIGASHHHGVNELSQQRPERVASSKKIVQAAIEGAKNVLRSPVLLAPLPD